MGRFRSAVAVEQQRLHGIERVSGRVGEVMQRYGIDQGKQQQRFQIGPGSAGFFKIVRQVSENEGIDFLQLGGDAAEGVYITAQFLPDDLNPRVKTVVDKYVAKYNETPDFFAIHAYDTMKLIAEAIKLGGPTREGVHSALPQLKDVPSVIYGTANFDPQTRRVLDPQFVDLQVKDGAFVVWDGVKPAAN